MLEDARRTPSLKPKVATLYFRKVPRDLRDQFKAMCYKRGSDMQTEILKLMRQYLSEKAFVVNKE